MVQRRFRLTGATQNLSQAVFGLDSIFVLGCFSPESFQSRDLQVDRAVGICNIEQCIPADLLEVRCGFALELATPGGFSLEGGIDGFDQLLVTTSSDDTGGGSSSCQ